MKISARNHRRTWRITGAAVALLLAAVVLTLAWRPAPRAKPSAEIPAAQTVSAPDAGTPLVPLPPQKVSFPQRRAAQSQPDTAYPDPFAPAFEGSQFVRMQAVPYQPEKWEVDLSTGIKLAPGERLERRTGIFRLNGIRYPLMRLDRVYKVGASPSVAASTSPSPNGATSTSSSPSVVASASSSPSGAASTSPGQAPAPPWVLDNMRSCPVGAASPTSPAVASTEAASPAATAPLDEAGGELVWSNAMVADHLMVQTRDGISRAALESALPPTMHVIEQVTDLGLYLVGFSAGATLDSATQSLGSLTNVVAFSEPNFAVGGSDRTPDDPLFTTTTNDTAKQWHLAKIGAPRAWDIVTGPPFPAGDPRYATRLAETVVAIVDSGIDYTHPDLAEMIWNNPNEGGGGKETNSVDDDANGKVDDWRGWDFIDNDKLGDNDPMDDVGHGTHVAGIIGGIGNNAAGGTGLCWRVKLLNLRIIKKQGTGTMGYYSGAVAAMDYIRRLNLTGRKVSVANHSWGGNGFSQALLNALAPPIVVGPCSYPKPYGCVHVAAAGNSRRDVDSVFPTYPASLKSGFVMSIGATDINDDLAVWQAGAGSNWGALTVDIVAPGSQILSTVPGGGYASYSGTSMAAPQVAGAIALIRMYQPYLTELQARQIVIDQADVFQHPDPTEQARRRAWCVSQGRLSVAKMMDSIYAPNLVADTAGQHTGAGDTVQALGGCQALYGRMSGNIAHSFFMLAPEGLYAWGGNSAAKVNAGAASALPTQPILLPLQSQGITMINGFGQGTSQGCLILRNDGLVSAFQFYDELERPIAGMTNIISIAAGEKFHDAIRDDGTVWHTRRNDAGDLTGLPGDLSYTAASAVPGISDVVQLQTTKVDADAWLAVALKKDGSVWSWRYPDNGLGDPTTPAHVSGLTGVVQVCGFETGGLLAVKDDGTVWEWGRLPGAVIFTDLPVQKAGLTGIVQAARGGDHAIALDSDGRLHAWGANDVGQLGNPSAGAFAVDPVSVVTFEGATWSTLAASTLSSAAVTSEGEVYSWGDNWPGSLGIGRDAGSQLPVQVRIPGAIIQGIAYGYYAGCYAVATDGKLYKWGPKFDTGGAFTSTEFLQTPELCTRLSNLSKFFVSSDAKISIAVMMDGSTWSWGYNEFGHLGRDTGTEMFVLTPAPIPSVVNPSKIDIGTNLCLAILPDKTVTQWGSLFQESGLPSVIAPVSVAGLTNISDVSAGYSHNLALREDGTVWAWGMSGDGCLGLGDSVTYTATPQQVPGLSNIVAIDTGALSSWALDSSGQIWVWGINPRDSVYHPSPVLFRSLGNNPVVVSGGRKLYFSDYAIYVLRNDGVLVSALVADSVDAPLRLLGRAPGSTAPRTEFAPVDGVSGIVDVHVSVQFDDGINMVLTSDGRVFAWGYGTGGSLGDNTGWSDVPLKVNGFAGVSGQLATLGAGELQNSWMLDKFSVSELSSTAVSGDFADPDGDGIPNILEYALGLDPKVFNSAGSPKHRVDIIGAQGQSTSEIELMAVPTAELYNRKRYQALTVTRSGIRQDIEYIVEVSADLKTWNSGDPHTVKIIDTSTTLEVYDATSLDDAPKRFIRLRVQRRTPSTTPTLPCQ